MNLNFILNTLCKAFELSKDLEELRNIRKYNKRCGIGMPDRPSHI